jgi:hypothetical protein
MLLLLSEALARDFAMCESTCARHGHAGLSTNLGGPPVVMAKCLLISLNGGIAAHGMDSRLAVSPTF